MCSQFPVVNPILNGTIFVGLTRPRSDPYIPVSIMTTLSESRSQSRGSKSFDDLSSSLSGDNVFTESSSDRGSFVKSCKNCGHSFHVRTPSTGSLPGTSSPPRPSVPDEFCSRDCATCYTLFPSPASCPKPQIVTGKAAACDIRQSIYAFQQELLLAEKNQRKETPPIETTPPKDEQRGDLIDVRQQLNFNDTMENEQFLREQLLQAKKNYEVKYFQELKKQKQMDSTEAAHVSQAGANHTNLFSWMFKQPRPLRPQLHNFI